MLDLLVKDEQEAGYTPSRHWHGPKRKISKAEQLRLAIVAQFTAQRKAAMKWVEEQSILPIMFPAWDTFKLGALEMSKRMTPIIEAVWDHSGSRFASEVNLDPDEWSVVNPHTAEKIRRASLAFCEETNRSTSHDLDTALDKLRTQLHEGIVDEGESVEQLTKRVQSIFETATKSRARTIAQTETSRAVHAAQDDAAHASGVVTGWRWQLSSDACPVCVAIAARNPVVRLGEPFAVIGKNPIYSHIFLPPAHPRCNCSAEQILVTDPQPSFLGGPLIDPKPSTDEELQTIRQQRRDRDEEILRGSEAWGAAPYAERYPSGRSLAQKPPKPRVVKLPKVRKKPTLQQALEAMPYEPAELPGQPLRAGEERLPARPSQAKVKLDQRGDVDSAAARIFGHALSVQQFANLSGIPDGEVEVYLVGSGAIKLSAKGPQLESGAHKYETLRTIYRENGRNVLSADEFEVHKSLRGEGIGTDVFSRMIKEADELGCSHIETFAAKTGGKNGYYTWPRLGYDALLSEPQKAFYLKALGREVNNISDVMETPEGRELWRERGTEQVMKFDLSPGSKSRKVWAAYLAEKATPQTSVLKNWKLQIELGRRSLAKAATA